MSTTNPLSDPSNPQSQPSDSTTVSNTPVTPTPAASAPNPQPSNTAQQTQQPVQTPQPASQPSQNGQQTGTVSNAPHPLVQKAGILRQAAEALGGGPRYQTSIDPTTGQTTRTQLPLSKRDIGMAIAMEAISGALGGLSVTGPGSIGKAAEAGFQQVSQQQKEAQQQQDQQAQQAFENQSQQLARRASIYETNSRAVLNTSQAEQMGAEAIDKLVDINRQSGVLDVDPALTDNNGEPMTQAELMDGMKSGKLSPTDQIGPVAGRVEITNPDGSKRWEATHLIVKDPNTPMTLSQEQWDSYADAGVPGFPKGTKISANGVPIPLRMLQNANEVAASHYLAGQRLSDLRDELDGTPEASRVPTSIDFSKPGVNAAMQRYQRYISHDAGNLEDPYTALQQMGAAKRDPKTGEMTPNPDAKYVDTVAQTFGGWPLLEAAHDQIAANKKARADFAVIDSADKANAVLAAPKRFTSDQLSAAKNFVSLAKQQGASKAAQEARARAVAEGTDVQAMYRFGRNPITGEQLSLNNAPDAMLVDSHGQVVPQDLTSTYKPSAQEKQTADTARQVQTISARLQAEVQKNPNLIGPLAGRSRQGLAAAGLGNAESQQMLDDLSFLQTAAVKMHTGRFSNQIIDKMGDLIKPGMNPDQFSGALQSINNVAGYYAQEDRLVSVGDLKNMQNNVQQTTNKVRTGNVSTPQQVQIPAGAQIGRDANGNVVGYKLPNGQFVSLGAQ
jgi:hypothetical protein